MRKNWLTLGFTVLLLTSCFTPRRPGQFVSILVETGPQRNYLIKLEYGTFKKECAAAYDPASNSPPSVGSSFCFNGYINESTTITISSLSEPPVNAKTYRFFGVNDSTKELFFKATIDQNNLPTLECQGTCTQVTVE